MQASLKELRTLKQEENTLMNLASKISDQLNRLKVEELALQSMIRSQEEIDAEVPMATDTDNIKQEEMTDAPLDLEVRTAVPGAEEEEEEEEEEEDEEEEQHYSVHDDLTQFVQELSQQTGS